MHNHKQLPFYPLYNVTRNLITSGKEELHHHNVYHNALAIASAAVAIRKHVAFLPEQIYSQVPRQDRPNHAKFYF